MWNQATVGAISADMLLRPSLAETAFDARAFRELCRRLAAGDLDPARTRLTRPPTALEHPPRDLAGAGADERGRLARAGRRAIDEGRVAALVMNGGMATRFGGGAKGAVEVVPGHPSASFLGIKLAQVRALRARVPVAIMHSFATAAASRVHLDAIDWAGIDPADRYAFVQSIMPRVSADGRPLLELPGADRAADTTVYAAPGHGDTLPSLRRSGVLDRLRERGVEHVLVSNVDNLGATLDAELLGAHLEAAAHGAEVTVEVVRREPGDAGGCVAQLPGSDRPAIVEGFRLPAGVELAQFPHFNTNTLWFSVAALARELPLQWFAVKRSVPWHDGHDVPAFQFEQLIGQVTEQIPSAFVEVDRGVRFLPIKTRDDLERHHDALHEIARAAGALGRP